MKPAACPMLVEVHQPDLWLMHEAETQETPREIAPVAPTTAWGLDWQKRGGRAGEDWVIRVGIMVADQNGMVTPLHSYLRATLTALVDKISAPTEQMRDAAALERAIHGTLSAALDVVESPVEMPDHFAAVLAYAMLWGNFLDAALALTDVALTADGTTLSIDAHTLGIISPREYASKRAQIDGAEPCTDFYAVSGPDRHDRGWHISTEDGLLAPSVLWGLMNALNCQFQGPAQAGKDKMRVWCASVTRRFLSSLHEHDVTREEFGALTASW